MQMNPINIRVYWGSSVAGFNLGRPCSSMTTLSASMISSRLGDTCVLHTFLIFHKKHIACRPSIR